MKINFSFAPFTSARQWAYASMPKPESNFGHLIQVGGSVSRGLPVMFIVSNHQ
jgi:hypothetical protein